MKLIDVLVKAEKGDLEDDCRVIIDDELFYWNSTEKKFYTTPKNKFQNEYRRVDTFALDLECDILGVKQ